MKTVLTFKFALFAVLFGGCSNGNSFYSSSTRPVKRSVSASKNIETRLPSGLRLEVSPLTFEIPTGTTQQLVATAIYDLDYRRDVTKEVVWRVDVAAAANAKMSESQAGLVNGLLPGSGGLTVTLNGASASAKFVVTATELAKIEVTPPQAVIPVKSTQSFKATGTYRNGTTRDVTAECQWTAGLAEIGSVETGGPNSGLATGKSVGRTVILATLGKIEGTGSLEVEEIKVVDVEISPLNPSIGLPAAQIFVATAIYADGSRKVITDSATWLSSKLDIAVFGAPNMMIGQALSTSVGVTEIKASFNGKTKTTALTVTAAKLAKIAITPASAAVNVGGSQQYTAIGTYEDATTADITKEAIWTTDLPLIGSISNALSSAGLAKGVAPGTATIRAALYSIQSNTASLQVKIPLVVLTVSKIGLGVISGGGIDCGPTCEKPFDLQTKVTLTAQPAAGFLFSGWTGACANKSGDCIVTMSQAQSVQAIFGFEVSLNAISAAVVQVAQNNGTPGILKIIFKTVSTNSNLDIISFTTKVLSVDFKLVSFSNVSASVLNPVTSRYEKTFDGNMKFKFIPLNKVTFAGQVFTVTVRDKATSQTMTADVTATLVICKQEYQSQCSTGPANDSLTGTAGHPLAIGNL